MIPLSADGGRGPASPLDSLAAPAPSKLALLHRPPRLEGRSGGEGGDGASSQGYEDDLQLTVVTAALRCEGARNRGIAPFNRRTAHDGNYVSVEGHWKSAGTWCCRGLAVPVSPGPLKALRTHGPRPASPQQARQVCTETLGRAGSACTKLGEPWVTRGGQACRFAQDGHRWVCGLAVIIHVPCTGQ